MDFVSDEPRTRGMNFASNVLGGYKARSRLLGLLGYYEYNLYQGVLRVLQCNSSMREPLAATVQVALLDKQSAWREQRTTYN